MKKLFLFFLILFVPIHARVYKYDLTIVGGMIYGDGIGKVPALLVNCMKDDVSINWRPTSGRNTVSPDVPSYIRDIVEKNQNDEPGRVAILTDLVWHPGSTCAYDVPSESYIKIAYSVHESTKIPPKWVTLLNEIFDCVVVPDPALVPIYKKSGVKLPIFVLPEPMVLDEFLEKLPKMDKGYPFAFGNVSGSWYRKNHTLLIKAFYKAFGNSPDVQLIMNSRGGEESQEIYNLLKDLPCNNIIFRENPLALEDYINFMHSLDCYVSLSMGEGFSLPPREALALGTPVILSTNSAHRTIVSSGFVRGVPCKLEVPAYYSIFGQELGSFFDCQISDASAALLDVYQNFNVHKERALMGKKWVERYKFQNLRKKFLNLIKPNKVEYGKINAINDDYVITNSKPFYDKLVALKNANNKDEL